MKPSAVHEGPLGAAVDLPAVRLAPAAAERVAIACCCGHAEVELDRAFSDEERVRAWESQGVREVRRRAWRAGAAAAVEAGIAELRLAGWRIEPPGSVLKGGL